MSELEERWIIKDDKSAEWALKKIREAQEDTARWNAYYAAQMETIERQNADTVAYFTALLEAWFATVPHKTTKTQESYQLPSGKLVRKAQQPSYERDAEALLGWAKTSFPEAVKVKEEASWTDIKNRIGKVMPDGSAVDKETGEIIDGVTVIERDPVFKVEIKEGK
jgi:hypothetical protein